MLLKVVTVKKAEKATEREKADKVETTKEQKNDLILKQLKKAKGNVSI